jgi:hypothetical protein
MTRHDTSSTVSTDGSYAPVGPVTTRGARLRPLSTQKRYVVEIVSAALRGSTTPHRSLRRASLLIVGACAEGTSSAVEIECVRIASTPPHGFGPPWPKYERCSSTVSTCGVILVASAIAS